MRNFLNILQIIKIIVMKDFVEEIKSKEILISIISYSTLVLVVVATTSYINNSIEIFSPLNVFNFCSRLLHIEFSINSIFGDSSIGSKSFQVFLGKLDSIEGSYLKVRMFTNDDGSSAGL